MTEQQTETTDTPQELTHLKLGGMGREKYSGLVGVVTVVSFHLDGSVQGGMEYLNNMNEMKMDWFDSARITMLGDDEQGLNSLQDQKED